MNISEVSHEQLQSSLISVVALSRIKKIVMTTEGRWQLDVIECYENKKVTYTGLQTKRIL